MSPNTVKRITSALVLISVVCACFYYGPKPTLVFTFFAGLIALDEIYCNFFKKRRAHVNYFLALAIYIVPYVFFNFISVGDAWFSIFINAGLLLNAFLFVFLFYLDMESTLVLKLGDKIPFFAALFILIPMMSLTSLLHLDGWRAFVTVLLFVNFGMDTGAWFFGKNFGKHKLWKKVSPNKTIEGLIGGSITSGLVGSLIWFIAFKNTSLKMFGLFCILGVLSQIGDLVQSKIKRQFGVKDSSQLIPGHGGVYDRIDSLIFLAPFYATIINYFYFQR
tara:strand:- start:211155 stop:211985 length:831 start_codon:yes stop_codon:yes gene_type:complete